MGTELRLLVQLQTLFARQKRLHLSGPAATVAHCLLRDAHPAGQVPWKVRTLPLPGTDGLRGGRAGTGASSGVCAARIFSGSGFGAISMILAGSGLRGFFEEGLPASLARTSIFSGAGGLSGAPDGGSTKAL